LAAESGGPVASARGASRFSALLTQARADHQVLAFVAPRGIGLTAWTADPKERIQIRRRFMLLGQTLAGMRVWDIRRAVQALRQIKATRAAPLALRASHRMAVNALYASLFEPGVARLDLFGLPASQRDGPDYLNVSRILDLPMALKMASAAVSVYP
jgi:hypothetical protein